LIYLNKSIHHSFTVNSRQGGCVSRFAKRNAVLALRATACAASRLLIFALYDEVLGPRPQAVFHRRFAASYSAAALRLGQPQLRPQSMVNLRRKMVVPLVMYR